MITPISGNQAVPVDLGPVGGGAPPAAQPPVAPQTVNAGLEAESAATEKAAQQAAKAQAAVIDHMTSRSGKDLTFRPSEVHFERDMQTGRVAVEVYDAITGDKVGQIPSEQLMKTMASIHQQIGLMLDKTG